MKKSLQSLKMSLGQELSKEEQKKIVGGASSGCTKHYYCANSPMQCVQGDPKASGTIGYCQAVWHSTPVDCGCF